MRQGTVKRLFSALLACCLLFTVLPFSASAEDSSTLSNEEKRAQLEQKLEQVNSKLAELGEQSKETEEYIDTLDEKISYLKNELTISNQEIENSKEKIESLEKQYDENEEEIKQLKTDIEELTSKSKELEKDFRKSYELYCERLRAMYISGDMSILSALLTCDDISCLLTRLEMIKQVSRSDSMLLEKVRRQGDKLTKSKKELEDKSNTLAGDQKTLKSTEESLKASIESLESQQKDYEQKQEAYDSEKAEADELLKKLHDETETYSEYRNQDEAELAQINADIAAAAEAFRKQMEAQTTTTTTTATTTTTTTTTTAPAQPDDSGDTTTAPPETTQPVRTQPTTQRDTGSLRMTYPVPSQTTITCGYGSAGYAGHTGVDFSCPTGSAVVAAESGYVIISADLVGSDGQYKSYGRYIVIMHDKTDANGNYVYTLYAHNSERLVSTGEYVSRGQTIAYSGSTGNSTGPHCHFEVRTPTADYSNCVNPTYYLP